MAVDVDFDLAGVRPAGATVSVCGASVPRWPGATCAPVSAGCCAVFLVSVAFCLCHGFGGCVWFLASWVPACITTGFDRVGPEG